MKSFPSHAPNSPREIPSLRLKKGCAQDDAAAAGSAIWIHQSTIPYQSPQWETLICWNFIFQALLCLTQTVETC
jgi:hypothetical protein